MPAQRAPADQPHLLRILLLVSLATGVIDAVCLLHLGVFTAYMTGTLILVGIHLGGALPLALPALIALGCFGLGAILGGRLIRYHPNAAAISHVRKLAHILTLDTVLIMAATILAACCDLQMPAAHYSCIAIIATAMGIQVAGSRQAGVLDMTIPAATMILHGLFFDSVAAGGKAERQGRRLAVIVALILGATLGTGLAQWRIWSGLLGGGVLLAGAAIASYALARRLVTATS
jgi:uncharacterized membrane protein YoaK (UPF0700 family)